MELVKALGIDFTIFIQFVVFVFTYIVLTRLIFRPYFKAFTERYNRTVGSEGVASKLVEETDQLQSEFEENAKALNFKIKNIFDDEKKSAIEAQSQKISEANLKAQEYRNSAELRLEESKKQIKDELRQEVEPIANLIKSTVLGKGATSQ